MNLQDTAKKIGNFFGERVKPLGNANIALLRKEIASLEREYMGIDLWHSLASCDKTEYFKQIILTKIESVKEQYHGCDAVGLARLQTQHTLLKELLYSYENAGTVKEQILMALKDKRTALEKGLPK